MTRGQVTIARKRFENPSEKQGNGSRSRNLDQVLRGSWSSIMNYPLDCHLRRLIISSASLIVDESNLLIFMQSVLERTRFRSLRVDTLLSSHVDHMTTRPSTPLAMKDEQIGVPADPTSTHS